MKKNQIELSLTVVGLHTSCHFNYKLVIRFVFAGTTVVQMSFQTMYLTEYQQNTLLFNAMGEFTYTT